MNFALTDTTGLLSVLNLCLIHINLLTKNLGPFYYNVRLGVSCLIVLSGRISFVLPIEFCRLVTAGHLTGHGKSLRTDHEYSAVCV